MSRWYLTSTIPALGELLIEFNVGKFIGRVTIKNEINITPGKTSGKAGQWNFKIYGWDLEFNDNYLGLEREFRKYILMEMVDRFRRCSSVFIDWQWPMKRLTRIKSGNLFGNWFC